MENGSRGKVWWGLPEYFVLFPCAWPCANVHCELQWNNQAFCFRRQRALHCSWYKIYSYEILNTIKAPCLEGVSQSELIKFEVDYSAYKDCIEDVNYGKPPSQRLKPSSICQCMKPRTIHSLWILGRIDGASSAKEVTDDSIKSWFKYCISLAIFDLSDRVEEDLFTIKFKPMPPDLSGAPENLMLEEIYVLDEFNASSIIAKYGQCEELFRKLEPPELRQIVTDKMRLWKNEHKWYLKYFTNTISTLAAQMHIVQCATHKVKPK